MSFDNGLIDLRSDTVTHPTPEMRRAMANAEVGDDVFDDDPTVHRLQEHAAALTGHEDSLYVASGTMGNLVALLVHCGRGDEVIVGNLAHIYLNEAGGLAGLVGAQVALVKNQPDGTLAIPDIEASIREDDVHHPRTRLICLENTQNICGGVPLSADYTQQVAELARDYQLKLHLDGARLFNAAVAQNIPASTLAGPFDSVTFCLSKGLSTPVGSMLCGSKDFIAEARRYRKQVGGGMRQVGVLAAAGLVALDSMIERLEDDHANAKRLAVGLRELPGIQMDEPHTNMVYFNLARTAKATPRELIAIAKQNGLLIEGGYDGGHFRLVTHYWITPHDVDKTIAVFRAALTP